MVEKSGARPQKLKKILPNYNPADARTHVSSDGKTVVLTPGERQRANDGSIVWNEADYRAGRIKDRNMISKPIGTEEFSRRKVLMFREGYYDRLD